MPPYMEATSDEAVDTAVRHRARTLHERLQSLMRREYSVTGLGGERGKLLSEVENLLRVLANPKPSNATNRKRLDFADALLWYHVRVALGHATPGEVVGALESIHDELFPSAPPPKEHETDTVAAES